ncbi:hypothetical protein [Deinococcus kurensis]|uniref:hypothetical protein n=1 Tax=Deinococcus kurensis TaxID=2662757 RepID=UPI0012D34F33|nr:hypothetical protein [Deinococcus kurensis]
MSSVDPELLVPESALSDYGAFMTWMNEQLAHVTLGALLEANAHLTSPLGLLRRSMLAMRERPVPKRDVIDWLATAHAEADADIQLLIEIFEQHSAVKRAHMEGMREADVLHLSLREYEQLLRRVSSRSSCKLHAEMELLATDGLIRSAKRLQLTDVIERYGPRFQAIAASFKNDYIFQHSMIHLSNAYTFLGQYVQALDILRDRQLLALAKKEIYPELLFMHTATNYFNLGNLEQALSILTEKYPESGRPARIQLSLDTFRTFNGQARVDRTSLGLPRYDWTMQALLLFAESDAGPPVGKTLTQREEQLRQVLTLSEHALTRDTYPTDLLFGYWLRARTRLLLGEYGMAVQELATVFEPLPEELFNRALLTALDLELAMTPLTALRVPLAEAERRFRQVFEDARTTRYANPESLARLVQRWHPQAAAYAALMPNPVRECLPALDLLVRVDQRATWRGQALPPALVPHLTRLNLHVPTVGVTLSGNAAYQVARLSRPVGEASVWGPVLPLLPVVVALSRGGEAHREAARRAWRDFGMLPGAHRDPALEGVVEVWRAVVAGERPLADGLRALQDL